MMHDALNQGSFMDEQGVEQKGGQSNNTSSV
jgi:hypothetical protein